MLGSLVIKMPRVTSTNDTNYVFLSPIKETRLVYIALSLFLLKNHFALFVSHNKENPQLLGIFLRTTIIIIIIKPLCFIFYFNQYIIMYLISNCRNFLLAKTFGFNDKFEFVNVLKNVRWYILSPLQIVSHGVSQLLLFWVIKYAHPKISFLFN